MAWKKGQSGNPHGKPLGQTSRGKFREQVDAALPGIVADLIAAAQGGDMAATKMILDRCIPALKPTADPVKVVVPSGSTLADQGSKVTLAALSGRLDMDSAKALIDILSAQSRLIEQSEVISRAQAIEKWLLANHTKES